MYSDIYVLCSYVDLMLFMYVLYMNYGGLYQRYPDVRWTLVSRMLKAGLRSGYARLVPAYPSYIVFNSISFHGQRFKP